MKNRKATHWILIQLDNNTYHPLLELPKRKKDLKGKAEITTVEDYQTSGVLSIYIKKHIEKTGKDTLIKIGEIKINNIPPAKAGEPTINITGKLKKNRYLSIEVTVENTKNTQKIFDLHEYLKKSITERIYPILSLILFGLFLVIALIPSRETKEKTIISSNHTSSPTKNTKPINLQPTTKPSPPPPIPKEKKSQTTIPTIPTTKTIVTKEILYFPPDSYHLREETKQKLENILFRLKKSESTSSIGRVKIYGHCALYGTEKGRYKLSYQRAMTVYKYLLSKGWKPRIKPEIKGWGGTRPVTRDPKKQNLNRRVEIIFTQIN